MTETARRPVDTNTDVTVRKTYLRQLTDDRRRASVRQDDPSSRQRLIDKL